MPTNALVNYPFDAEISLNTEDGVAIVDAGGDCGQAMRAVRTKFPALQGRIIVQDLKEAIEIIEDSTGFEPMVHDFLEPRPVRGEKTPAPPCSP
jgi:demethylsterigmatocystin 6-O-methyltransferase